MRSNQSVRRAAFSRCVGLLWAALFALLSPVQGLAQIAAGEAFHALEQRLLDAEEISLEFDITAEGAVAANLKGQMSIVAPQVVTLRAKGVFAGSPVDLFVESRGDDYAYGHVAQQKMAPLPAHLREAMLIGFTRMGLLHNLAMLSAGAAPDHADGGVTSWVIVDNVSDEEGVGLQFEISVAGAPAGAATLQIEEGLPVTRRQTVQFPNGEMRVVERYSEVLLP